MLGSLRALLPVLPLVLALLGCSGGSTSDGSTNPSLPPQWKKAASPKLGRVQHTATLLQDGRVLVTGGSAPGTPCTKSVEIYDPAADAWTEATPLPKVRQLHGAVRLQDGRVLVAGGWDCKAREDPKTAEVFDPATQTWTATGPMLAEASEPDLQLMPDGRVVMTTRDLVQFYDPAANAFTLARHGGMHTFAGATATPLPNGDFVTAGGGAAVEPRADSLTVTAGSDPAHGAPIQHPLNDKRAYHRTVQLDDGRLLAIGGVATSRAGSDRRVELFDPTSRAWSYGPATDLQGRLLSLTKLPDGRALAMGFANGERVWIFTPETSTWASLPQPGVIDLRGHTATLLADGRVLVLQHEHALIVAP